MKNNSNVRIVYDDATSIKEIINETQGIIVYKILDLGDFIRNNKTLSRNGTLDVYNDFINIIWRDDAFIGDVQPEHNYLSEIVSIAKTRDGDVFNKEAGEKIAYAKLMKKVYTRLGKINKFNCKYYSSKFELVKQFSAECSHNVETWHNRIQKIDSSVNTVN